MDNLTKQNPLVMYVIAREKYLATLLKEGVISTSEFEKMSKLLKEHFQITNSSIDGIRDMETAITVTPPATAQALVQPETEVTDNIPIASSEPADTTPDFVSLTESIRAMTNDTPGHVIQS